MTIKFRGLSAPYDAPSHEPEFTPDVGYTKEGSCHLGMPGHPLEWSPDGLASGLISKVRLNGEYWVIFKFEDVELENWLKSYVTEYPEKALSLLVEMLQLTIASRKKKES
jgi:hypothetical protein